MDSHEISKGDLESETTLVTSERSERFSYQQFCMGRLFYIQTAIQHLKNRNFFITILGQAESFKTTNRPDLSRLDHNAV